MKNKIISLLVKFTSNPKKKADLIKKYFGVKMGSDCEVYSDVSFGSEPFLIELGDNVRVTNGVKFITHDGGVYVLRNNGMAPGADIFGKIKIGNNVHIGINTIIMPGVEIGNNVVVGTGAVVTKDLPSGNVYAGVPARKIKTIEEYYIGNKDNIVFTKNLTPLQRLDFLKKID